MSKGSGLDLNWRTILPFALENWRLKPQSGQPVFGSRFEHDTPWIRRSAIHSTATFGVLIKETNWLHHLTSSFTTAKEDASNEVEIKNWGLGEKLKMETIKALMYESQYYHKSRGETCKTQHVTATAPKCQTRIRGPQTMCELINDAANISRWKSGIQHLFGSLAFWFGSKSSKMSENRYFTHH
jgi:hypothetical protein